MLGRVNYRFGVAVVLLSPFVIAVGNTPASAASQINPNLPSCIPGNYYSETSHSEANYGKGPAIYIYNYNAASASLSEQFTSSIEMSYASTATGTAEVDLIVATIGGSGAVTIGKTTTESTSATATVNNVPAHTYGVIQLGDTFWKSVGTYGYLSSYCVASNLSTVTSRFPINPNTRLILAGVNSVPAPPWPQES